MKKILVTGSNGLLGTALKKILGADHIYHTRQDCDLLNYNDTYEYINYCVKTYGINTIIHTAARVGGVKANLENNTKFFYENYYISNNVLKCAYELGIDNFVNVLSTCIFPDTNITYPLTYDQIDNGAPHFSNYGYSYAKRLSGYETKIFRDVLNKNWFSVVATNLYGPNDNFNLENSHLIPGMIHRAYLAKQNNQPFTIWGDGSPLRQFVYSEDLARLIIWSIDNWTSREHCMMVNEHEYSVMDIAMIIKNKFQIPDNMIIFDTDKPKGQFRKPATSDVTHYKFKNIHDGISDTIDWFVSNYNTLRK
jgi:GDP-L-fucose synthase